jgi:hypothetical protein
MNLLDRCFAAWAMPPALAQCCIVSKTLCISGYFTRMIPRSEIISPQGFRYVQILLPIAWPLWRKETSICTQPLARTHTTTSRRALTAHHALTTNKHCFSKAFVTWNMNNDNLGWLSFLCRWRQFFFHIWMGIYLLIFSLCSKQILKRENVICLLTFCFTDLGDLVTINYENKILSYNEKGRENVTY